MPTISDDFVPKAKATELVEAIAKLNQKSEPTSKVHQDHHEPQFRSTIKVDPYWNGGIRKLEPLPRETVDQRTFRNIERRAKRDQKARRNRIQQGR